MSAPVPPSSAVPLTPSKPTSDGVARFGRVPIWPFLSVALVTIAGAVTYVLTATATVVAMCGSERMTPNMVCDTERNGIVTKTETYGQVLQAAKRANQVGQGIGIALVLIGVVFGVLVYIRWQQDRQLKAQLSDDHGPALSSHGRTVSTSLFAILLGAGLIGLAGYFLLTGMGKGEPGYYIGTALAAAAGLAFLYVAIPKNGQLVQVFEPGLRIASKGRLVELPWREVGYTIVPGRGMATHVVSGPGVGKIQLGALSDSDALQDVAQGRSVDARYRPALEAINRGETVSFGKIDVSRAGIAVGSKQLPWSSYGGIMLAQGQVTIAQIGKGRFTTVNLGMIENYTLLVHVIAAVASQAPQSGPAY